MSDMKCPFCGQKLESLFVENRPVFACCNLNCKGYFMNAPKELWQELIRTRKALDVAIDVLKSTHEYYQNCVIRERQPHEINWYYIAKNMHNDIFKALEQITALEQKDVK